MRILFIVPYTPNQIRTRPFNLIKGLASRGHDVTLASLWSSDRELDELGELIQFGVEVVGKELSQWRSIWNCLIGVKGSAPFQCWYCWHPGMARTLAAKVSREQFDVIHVEHLRGVRYLLELSDGENGKSREGVPIIWDSVDCISYLFGQAKRQSPSLKTRLISGIELNRTRRFESWLVNRLGRILVTSDADESALLKLAQDRSGNLNGFRRRLSILPNGVDLDYFSPTNEQRKPASLVLSGKMSYHANEAAALYLLKKIMPSVWDERPEVELWIVGKNPSEQLKSAAGSRVHLTGYVDDIRPYLRSSAISVSPVVYGAGIQNKVLEAMACATPVVATSQATAALDVVAGRDLVIANDSELFSKEILRLLEDPERGRAIGNQGRRFVESHHSWDVVTTKLERIYESEMKDLRAVEGRSLILNF